MAYGLLRARRSLPGAFGTKSMQMIKTACLALATLMATTPLALAEPFHHPFGEWREYNHDWLAACPDTIEEGTDGYYGISCFASAGSVEKNSAGQPAYKLTVMLNRLTGALDVAVSVQADGVTVDQERTLLVSFAGDVPLTYDFRGDLETRYNTINQFYFTDEAERDALLDLMKQRNAVTLTIPVDDAAKPTRVVQLSLRGVTASIDFMTTYARKVAEY